MKPILALAVLAALAGGASLGATPAPTSPPARLFLSPSGEPFRLGPQTPDPFEAWFDQADADHDGSIDRAEFRADAAQFFQRLDADGDGVIDSFELTAYETKIVPELVAEVEGRFAADEPRAGGHPEGGEPDRRGHGGGDGGRRRGPVGRGIAQLLNEPEPVSGADFNLDGRITLAEWMTAADQRFDLLDTAKTGLLTREALKARLPTPPKPRR